MHLRNVGTGNNFGCYTLQQSMPSQVQHFKTSVTRTESSGPRYLELRPWGFASRKTIRTLTLSSGILHFVVPRCALALLKLGVPEIFISGGRWMSGNAYAGVKISGMKAVNCVARDTISRTKCWNRPLSSNIFPYHPHWASI